jgi:hypothetical protein
MSRHQFLHRKTRAAADRAPSANAPTDRDDPPLHDNNNDDHDHTWSIQEDYTVDHNHILLLDVLTAPNIAAYYYTISALLIDQTVRTIPKK